MATDFDYRVRRLIAEPALDYRHLGNARQLREQ